MDRGEIWPRARAFRPLDWLLLGAIGFYQQRVSPRKGWRCAYSVLHGGTGCSGYAKSVIAESGWRAARPLVQQRFRDCKHAGQTLRHQRPMHLEGTGEGGQGPLGSDSPWGAEQKRRKSNKAPNGRTGGNSKEGGWCDSCGCDDACDFSWCSLADSLQHCHLGHLNACACGDLSHCGSPCHGCDAPGCDCGGCDCTPCN